MILPENEKETRYVVGLAALWVWARQADAAGEIALGKQRSDSYHARVKEAVQFGTRADGLVETAMVRALTFIDKNGDDQAIEEELAYLEQPRLDLHVDGPMWHSTWKDDDKPAPPKTAEPIKVEPKKAESKPVVVDDNKPASTAKQRVEKAKGDPRRIQVVQGKVVGRVGPEEKA